MASVTIKRGGDAEEAPPGRRRSVMFRGSQCGSCGFLDYPPKRVCKGCNATTVHSVDLAPRGVVLTHAVVRVPLEGRDAEPLPIALVRLDAGPVMTAALACAPEEIQSGTAVTAILREGETLTGVWFVPVERSISFKRETA